MSTESGDQEQDNDTASSAGPVHIQSLEHVLHEMGLGTSSTPHPTQTSPHEHSFVDAAQTGHGIDPNWDDAFGSSGSTSTTGAAAGNPAPGTSPSSIDLLEQANLNHLISSTLALMQPTGPFIPIPPQLETPIPSPPNAEASYPYSSTYEALGSSNSSGLPQSNAATAGGMPVVQSDNTNMSNWGSTDITSAAVPTETSDPAETLAPMQELGAWLEADIFNDEETQGSALSMHPYGMITEGDRTTNFSFDILMKFWRQMFLLHFAGYPRISQLAEARRLPPRPQTIDRKLMAKTKCDFQGIHWSRYTATKSQARDIRRMTYRNHTNLDSELEQLSVEWCKPGFKANFASPTTRALPKKEKYFRFDRIRTDIIPLWRHYQLRHNIFAASQNSVYYHRGPHLLNPSLAGPGNNRFWSVNCYNPLTGDNQVVMEPKLVVNPDVRLDGISTLSADHDILVVGSLLGVYGMRSLTTEFDTNLVCDVVVQGQDYNADNSTNHVHTCFSRHSGLPQAIFNSNDLYVRVLDCTTNKWVQKHRFNSPINCSCTDPSGRLRLIVSDDPYPIVADVDAGQQLAKLTGHTDHGFACAWAPDGITMATGYQDGIVQVFDLRNLKRSVVRIPAEQSGVRCMQFSPLGSGKPVLVLGEPSDFVHIVNADTFRSRQTIEFFGEIAGISLTPDGQSLFIANADHNVGGLMEFNRTQITNTVAADDRDADLDFHNAACLFSPASAGKACKAVIDNDDAGEEEMAIDGDESATPLQLGSFSSTSSFTSTSSSSSSSSPSSSPSLTQSKAFPKRIANHSPRRSTYRTLNTRDKISKHQARKESTTALFPQPLPFPIRQPPHKQRLTLPNTKDPAVTQLLHLNYPVPALSPSSSALDPTETALTHDLVRSSWAKQESDWLDEQALASEADCVLGSTARRRAGMSLGSLLI